MSCIATLADRNRPAADLLTPDLHPAIHGLIANWIAGQEGTPTIGDLHAAVETSEPDGWHHDGMELQATANGALHVYAD